MMQLKIEPRKTFKKVFKIMKKEKCLSKGVTIGGQNHGCVYASIHKFL